MAADGVERLANEPDPRPLVASYSHESTLPSLLFALAITETIYQGCLQGTAGVPTVSTGITHPHTDLIIFIIINESSRRSQTLMGHYVPLISTETAGQNQVQRRRKYS